MTLLQELRESLRDILQMADGANKHHGQYERIWKAREVLAKADADGVDPPRRFDPPSPGAVDWENYQNPTPTVHSISGDNF